MRDGKIVAASREATNSSVSAVVSLLLDAPTAEDEAAGLRSAIPAGTHLLGLSTRNGVGSVNVSKEFVGVSGDEQVLAVAQIVYTVTSVPGIDAVTVAVDGHDIEVPGADGSLLGRPVARGDYAPLAA